MASEKISEKMSKISGFMTRKNLLIAAGVLAVIAIVAFLFWKQPWENKKPEAFAGYPNEAFEMTLYKSDTCPHCIKTLPLFKAACDKLAMDMVPVETKIVDIKKSPEAAAAEGITSVPTIVLENKADGMKTKVAGAPAKSEEIVDLVKNAVDGSAPAPIEALPVKTTE